MPSVSHIQNKVDEFAGFSRQEITKVEKPSLNVMIVWGFIAGMISAFWATFCAWMFLC
jgi:hypothetical protein